MKYRKKNLSHSVCLTDFTLCASKPASARFAQQNRDFNKSKSAPPKENLIHRQTSGTGEELQHLPVASGDPLKAAQIPPSLTMQNDGGGAVPVCEGEPIT